MLGRHIFPMILAAVAIATTVTVFLAPKVEPVEVTPAVASARPVSEAATAPTPVQKTGNRAAIIDRADDGHYWTRADVGGTEVKFMVDTGASIVALTRVDAQRIGLHPETLDFDNEIRTAGGVTYGAFVILDSIRIGGVEIEDVSAMVLDEGLDQSLLGMTFLGELYSYEFKKNTLIIHQ